MNEYLIPCDEKFKEHVIKNIVHNYQFPLRIINTINKGKGKQQLSTETSDKKWMTFTYIGKETNYMTELFKMFSVGKRTQLKTQSVKS
jgi:hypothetical protein